MASILSRSLSSVVPYQRHQPEKTLLYKLIQKNLLHFYHQVEKEQEKELPYFVKKEFEEFLKCGLLSYGFLRLQCQSCKQERLLAFSCKRRGFCPSCGAKRMAEMASHLVDEVLPYKPLRQWVLSFPFPLRLLFAKAPQLTSLVLNLVLRAIFSFLIKKAGFKKKSGAKTGSVTFLQQFGGSLNLNIHFHILCSDGVWTFKGAQVLLNVTNDSWYGSWQEPWQHLYMSLARAVETRRPLIRGTNTGLSTVIQANGNIMKISPLNKEWTHLYSIPYREKPQDTLFMSWGFYINEIFLLLLSFLGFAATFIHRP